MFRTRRPRAVHPLPCLLAAALALGSAAVLAEPLSIVESMREGVNGAEGVGHLRGFVVLDDLLIARGTSFDLFERDATSGRITLLDALEPVPSSEPLDRGQVRHVTSSALMPDGSVVVTGTIGDPDVCVGLRHCSGSGVAVFSTSTRAFELLRSRFPNRSFKDLVPSPDGRNLYAPLSGAPGLDVLRITETGDIVHLQHVQEVRIDGEAQGVRQLLVARDGSRVIVLTARSNLRPSALAVLERDTSGRLIPLSTLSLEEMSLVERIDRIALSPDERTLYATATSRDADGVYRSGLLRLRLDADGTLEALDLDGSPNDAFEGSLSFPGPLAVSGNGHLVYVANGNSGFRDSGRSVHLYTVDDDGVIWRGLESENKDGVLPGTLRDVTALALSPDGAFLYVGSLNENTLSIFAVHADTRAQIEPVARIVDEGTAIAVVRVFNAGPAVAHGISATVESTADILATSRPDACHATAGRVDCDFDTLRPLESIELRLTLAAAPEVGAETEIETAPELTLRTTQHQTDLDPASNDSSAVLRVVAADPDADPSASGASGCSIGTIGDRDPLLPAFALGALALAGLRRSRRDHV